MKITSSSFLKTKCRSPKRRESRALHAQHRAAQPSRLATRWCSAFPYSPKTRYIFILLRRVRKSELKDVTTQETTGYVLIYGSTIFLDLQPLNSPVHAESIALAPPRRVSSESTTAPPTPRARWSSRPRCEPRVCAPPPRRPPARRPSSTPARRRRRAHRR